MDLIDLIELMPEDIKQDLRRKVQEELKTDIHHAKEIITSHVTRMINSASALDLNMDIVLQEFFEYAMCTVSFRMLQAGFSESETKRMMSNKLNAGIKFAAKYHNEKQRKPKSPG